MRDEEVNAQKCHEIGIQSPLSHGIAVTACAKRFADHPFLAVQLSDGSAVFTDTIRCGFSFVPMPGVK